MKILIAKRVNGWNEVLVIDDNGKEHRQFFKHTDTVQIDKYVEIYNTKVEENPTNRPKTTSSIKTFKTK